MALQVIVTNNTWNFDTLLNKIPEPIHTIASLPVDLQKESDFKRIFPSKDWAVDNDGDDIDDHKVVHTVLVVNPTSNYSVADVSQSVVLPVCKLVDIWIEGIQQGEEDTGNAHRISVKLTEEVIKSYGMLNSCPMIEKRNIL